ncbi:choline transporter-like protein 1 [Caerostris extrusa]|uniref:Choline transporter-like protein n=1 Tax=Caerostris extrusa TaxID=172846 RepID=A0AAV4UY23_CAEEX|nr:choline transporter-like protein 1 [Caerostris extrusa]
MKFSPPGDALAVSVRIHLVDTIRYGVPKFCGCRSCGDVVFHQRQAPSVLPHLEEPVHARQLPPGVSGLRVAHHRHHEGHPGALPTPAEIVRLTISGDSFCASARKSFGSLTANVLKIAAVDCIGDFILFVGKMGVTISVALIALEVLKVSSSPSTSFMERRMWKACITFGFPWASLVPSLSCAAIAFCLSMRYLWKTAEEMQKSLPLQDARSGLKRFNIPVQQDSRFIFQAKSKQS